MNTKNIIKQNIKKILRECIEEQKEIQLKEHIKQIIKEELEKENNDDIKGQRTYVMSTLQNDNEDKYDHAYLAYSLWPSMDKDTARSYFSKCVRGEREFDDKDITNLFDLLRSKS